MLACKIQCFLLTSFYTLGPVTEVQTDIYVTSFGPVSDVEMVRISGIKMPFCGAEKPLIAVRNECLIHISLYCTVNHAK